MSKSTATRYTNMSTIFEKVKMGEISSTPQRRLFTNLDYKKKAELIKPYLHPIDDFGLKRTLDRTYGPGNNNNYSEQMAAVQNAITSGILTKKDGKDAYTFLHKMREIYTKLPREIFADIYNQYYSNIKNLKYEDRTDSNKNRFRMVDKANDPVTKIITSGSNIKSLVFTKSMIEYLLTMLVKMEDEDPEEFQKFMNNLKGNGQGEQKAQGNNNQPSEGEGEGEGEGEEEGSPDEPSSSKDAGQKSGKGDTGKGSYSEQLEKILKRFTEEPNIQTQQFFDKQMDRAKETVDALEKGLSEEDIKKMWSDLTKGNLTDVDKVTTRLNPESVKNLRDELAKIRMNMSGLKSTIKNLLDKSIAFFSAKEKVTFDQFLDNPMIDEIQEYMYLHPKLRKVCVDDLLVKEIERKGKIDVYVDVSGSMGSSAQIKGLSGSERISRLTFAKSLVLKLKEMDMLNDVYSFQNRVSKEGNTVSDIVFIDGNGGTSLNNVVKKIEENGTNALIITDAEDRCQMYSDKAFFIGVAGSDFRSFEDNVVAEYSRRNQIVIFDGNRIMKVDSKGCTV
jgi:hypothetical protein